MHQNPIHYRTWYIQCMRNAFSEEQYTDWKKRGGRTAEKEGIRRKEIKTRSIQGLQRI